MKIKSLLMFNCGIAAFSLTWIYFLDWPLEALGILGISWVLISSFEALRKLKNS